MLHIEGHKCRKGIGGLAGMANKWERGTRDINWHEKLEVQIPQLRPPPPPPPLIEQISCFPWE